MYDKTLEFEQHKDEPVRYNRETYVKTIAAMNKVEEIKKERQMKFWRQRMAIAKDNNRKAVINELKNHAKLIKNPKVKERIQERIRGDEQKRAQRNKRVSKLHELIEEDKEESEVEEEEGLIEESVDDGEINE